MLLNSCGLAFEEIRSWLTLPPLRLQISAMQKSILLILLLVVAASFVADVSLLMIFLKLFNK